MAITAIDLSWLLLVSSLLGDPHPVQVSDPAGPRIVVSPDMLVSQGEDFRHVELMVAANPKRPANLLGAAMLGDWGSGVGTYVSLDGGRTWAAHRFAEAAGDPQVTFTTAGTALFATLAARDADEVPALFVYRSSDGGVTWSQPIDLGRGYDHPQIVVDRTQGLHAGRIYLGVLWGSDVYRIGVFRSDDDGRSWSGPVESANGGGEIGINVCPMLVASDGTLFVPYIDFEFKAEKKLGELRSGIWSVISTDGGLTFSAPRAIATARYGERFPVRFQQFPMFASAARASAFADRILAAWNVMREGRPAILTAWSADGGRTWSDPRPLPQAAAGEQFQPSLAVNEAGVLGITWYETHPELGEKPCSARSPCFHQHFTASRDGGLTFLPPVRVSSSPSYTRWRLSSEDRYGNGGDYMGLTVESGGAFRSLWADSRSGTFQVYTAAIQVMP